MAQARYADAIDDYSAAIACQPDYAAAYFNRAIAFQRSGARQKACADVREARRLGYDVEDNMMLKFCGD
jgi:tetratricopeptide (TPR) repeat protein